MTERSTAKKHIVTSYRNLTPEMQDAIREQYPLGGPRRYDRTYRYARQVYPGLPAPGLVQEACSHRP